jgi:hypothetical protein
MKNKPCVSKRPLYSLLTLFLTLISFFLLWVWYLAPCFEKIFSLTPLTTKAGDAWLVITPIATYILVTLCLCLLTNTFHKLRGYDGGLLRNLSICFGIGTALSVAIFCMERFSPFCLIVTLPISLFYSLLIGIITGIIEETV